MTLSDPRVDASWQALRMVIDPELGVNIVRLGLVFDVVIRDDIVHITHTLTTRGCPMEHVIRQGIGEAMQTVEGVARFETHLVWDPAWHPGMIEQDVFQA